MANLVDNENPTSTQNIPMNDDILPNSDTDNLDNLTQFNNLKGSYNNLFCDNLDDELGQTVDDKDIDVEQKLFENVYCNVSPAKQQQPMYNNNKFVTDLIGNDTDDSLKKTDPNLHVYSNINSTVGTEVLSPTTISNTPNHSADHSQLIKTKLNDMVFNNNIESIMNDSIMRKSSTMLSDDLDDLDLDDPTIASGSIGGQGATLKIVKNGTDSMDRHSYPLNSVGKLKKSHLETNSMPTDIKIKPKKLFNESIMVDGSGNHSTIDNSSFLGQRIRSLHDTTMIDTALDLDSLDDSSIGNNSQACVENTKAIV